MTDGKRIVITGIGLTSPNGNNLTEFRSTLLSESPLIDRRSFIRSFVKEVKVTINYAPCKLTCPPKTEPVSMSEEG